MNEATGALAKLENDGVRRPARARPAKPLPTDRMKFDLQVKVLHAMAGMGHHQFGSEVVANALSGEVSHYTVSLSNAFFVESGWLDRAGRGSWQASEALLNYNSQRHYEEVEAMDYLRQAATGSWAWEVIGPMLDDGQRRAVRSVKAILAKEAAVAQSHETQLNMVLEWWKFVGLVAVEDDEVVRADTAAVPAMALSKGINPPATTESTPAPGSATPARAEVPEPTTSVPGRAGAMLNFDFNLSLTAEDLSELSPEQIAAVFEAVGKVIAIKKS